MKRLAYLGSLALTLASIIATAALVLPTVAQGQFQWPEWVVYNTHNSGLPHDDGYNFAIDAQGNVWRGTEGGGAAKTDGMGDWTAYNPSNSGLPDNDAFCIAFDGQGNAWIGTWSRGLAKFDGAEGWTVYNTSNSELPKNCVISLAVDDQENVWIGTLNGGLAKFDGESTWAVYDTSNSGLPSMAVRALTFDDQGNLWMATQRGGGMAKFDGAEEWTVYNTSNSGLPGDSFPGTGLAFDAEGNLWVGTEASAAKFDGVEGWTVYNTSNSGLPNNVVYDFAFDGQGNVWMGTQGGGVAKFDGAEEWTVYNTSNSGLPYDFITGLAIDAEGNLWIGTGRHHDGGASKGGVAVYREGGVIPHGLSDEFARLTSATRTLGVTLVGQPTPLEVTLVFDAPLEAGKTLRLDLTPLGIPSDLALEHIGDGRYTGSTTVTAPQTGRYDLPILVETTEGKRYRFLTVTLDVYPTEDVYLYRDQVEAGWRLKRYPSYKAEADPNSTDYVHSGSYACAITLQTRGSVEYVVEDPDGLATFGYATLEFWLNPGKASIEELNIVAFMHVGTAPKTKVLPLVEQLGLSFEPETWQQVSIPAEALELTDANLEKIRFTGDVQGTFYIDDMRLVAEEVEITAVEEVSEATALPLGYALSQNYPNPFNPQTTIQYALPEAGAVRLSVYNMLGQMVRTLVDGYRPAGSYSVVWDGRDGTGREVASGVYLYRLEVKGQYVQARRMVLLR